MESSSAWIFLDRDGQLLSARVQQALRNVLPQLRKHFSSFNNDELAFVEILEEAGSRIEDHERGHGRVDSLDAYTWRTVQNVARSRLRRWSTRLFRSMLSSSDGEAALDTLPAQYGSAEQIECAIEYKEIQTQLTVREQRLCTYRKLGMSSREIARQEGMSVVSVNTHFYRIKRKIRAMRESGVATTLAKTSHATRSRTA